MRTLCVAVLALGVAVIAPAGAQGVPGTIPGLSWVGCWEASDGLPSAGTICVIPSSNSALRLVTIAPSGSLTESTLILDGSRVQIDSDGCTGWEEARLSGDGERILIDSELRCGAIPSQRRSVAFMITVNGDWIQAQGSGISMITSAQVRLYRSVVSLGRIPESVMEQVGPFLGLAERARLAVGQRTPSASDLLELESMGVADPIIDVIVAAAFPENFDLFFAGEAVAAAGDPPQESARTWSPSSYGFGYSSLSSFDLMTLGGCSSLDFYPGPSRFCSNASLGYGSRYYGNRYYDPYYTRYGSGVPVVVVPVASNPNQGSVGRNVKGQGYSNSGTTTSTRTAIPRSSGTTSASGTGSSSAGTASAGTSTGGSSSGTARTAKPRSP